MALSVVALHVAANVVDYCIAKYAAKPMEQLQNLVTQYASGIKRLEDDEAKEAASAQDETQPIDPKRRAKRVTPRLQFAANRSSWVSATECALFVHTEQVHWVSHNEVPIFLSRPLCLISECKRLLWGSDTTLTRAATIDVMSVDFAVATRGSEESPHATGDA